MIKSSFFDEIDYSTWGDFRKQFRHGGQSNTEKITTSNCKGNTEARHAQQSFRHYKSPPFHTVIRIHLISLSFHILVVVVISFYFYGANVNVNNLILNKTHWHTHNHRVLCTNKTTGTHYSLALVLLPLLVCFLNHHVIKFNTLHSNFTPIIWIQLLLFLLNLAENFNKIFDVLYSL